MAIRQPLEPRLNVHASLVSGGLKGDLVSCSHRLSWTRGFTRSAIQIHPNKPGLSWVFRIKCYQSVWFGRTLFLANSNSSIKLVSGDNSQHFQSSKSSFHTHIPGIEGDVECNYCTWIIHLWSLINSYQGFASRSCRMLLTSGSAYMALWGLLWCALRRKASKLKQTDTNCWQQRQVVSPD